MTETRTPETYRPCLDCALDCCYICAANTDQAIGRHECCCGRIHDPNPDDDYWDDWPDDDV